MNKKRRDRNNKMIRMERKRSLIMMKRRNRRFKPKLIKYNNLKDQS
jgi:hypothetical protein